MHAYDTLFFDEFKQLEQLCQQIYNQPHGVTAYIDDMEATPQNIAFNVSGWKDDYYKLKRCRHIRNQLAHDTLSSTQPLSTAEDLAFIQNFRQRVMNRQDPLALAGIQRPPQSSQPQQPIIQTPNTQPQYTPPPPRPKTRKEKVLDTLAGIVGGTLGCILGIAGFIAVCVLLLFILGGIGNWLGSL